mgnify:CR=1 FL=1
MIDRARGSLEQLRRDDPEGAQGLPTPEQWFPSRSAPGTEAFKQDYAKWESLKKDVRLAVERLEQSLSAKLDERGRRGRVDAGRDDRAPEPWRAETARYFRAVAEKSRP